MSYQKTKDWKSLPGDTGLPLIGNTFSWASSPIKFAKKRYETYGEVSKVNILGNPGVFLIGPDANELVMRDRSNRFSSTKAYEPFIGELFPGALGMKDFSEHARDRRILQSAFTKNALSSYSDTINELSSKELSNWKAGEIIQFFYRSKEIFLDQAVTLFLDSAINHDTKLLGTHFLNIMSAATSIIRLPLPFVPYGRGLRSKDFLWNHLERSLPEKKATLTNDLLSRVCHAESEQGEKLSDREIVGHMLGLLSAAHETTTSAATSIAYAIAKWPMFQERMRDELLALNSPLSFETSKSLEFTQNVFNECMRLWGSSHSIPRHILTDFEYKGYYIPKDCTVYLSPSYTHRMSEYWSNPNEFDPDRFSKEREEHKQKKFLYMPFGGGAHICIGMIFAELQIKIFFWHLLRKYNLKLDKADYSYDLKYTPLPIPKDGLRIILEPR